MTSRLHHVHHHHDPQRHSTQCQRPKIDACGRWGKRRPKMTERAALSLRNALSLRKRVGKARLAGY